jgi:hypothetical protein
MSRQEAFRPLACRRTGQGYVAGGGPEPRELAAAPVKPSAPRRLAGAHQIQLLATAGFSARMLTVAAAAAA